MAMDDINLPVSIYSYRTRKEFSIPATQFVADSGDVQAWVNHRIIFGYELVFENLTYDQAGLLRAFYHCRSGELRPFRFQDVLDANTSANGIDAVANTNQPIVTIIGVKYLVKQYGNTYRVIRLPDLSSLTFPAGGSANALTGVYTGSSTTWGGVFDVPVHFIGEFHEVWNDWNAVTVNVQIEEVLEDL